MIKRGLASAALLRCPRCAGALVWGDEVRCASCSSVYPQVLGIPVLMNDPQATLDSWRAKLHAFVTESQLAEKHVLMELLDTTLKERARKRLSSVAEGLSRRQRRIVELFERAEVVPQSLTAASVSDEAAELRARSEGILSYSSLILRDYAWPPEVDEVATAVDLIVSQLPDAHRLGTTLVLGAGTGRLAWELGTRLKEDAPLLALDINPLPFLVTQQLLSGEQLMMDELPAHPRRSTFACVEQRLRAPGDAPPGLTLLFADALEPPVCSESFDTLITPWFVDQVPSDMRSFLPKLFGLLKPGGTWLCQGPFVYKPELTSPAARYAADEFVEWVGQAGFAVRAADYSPQSYMASPYSAQSRTEWVLTLFAQKSHSFKERSPSEQPDFLRPENRSLPVPPLELSSAALPDHLMVRQVARLVNGKRSVAAITDELILAGVLAADESAEVAVRACLGLIVQAQRRD